LVFFYSDSVSGNTGPGSLVEWLGDGRGGGKREGLEDLLFLGFEAESLAWLRIYMEWEGKGRNKNNNGKKSGCSGG
jgi:hypothetical protein